MSDNNSQGNNFLFIAHPGHELCVYAWLTLTKPKVFVLTDGSGRVARPRIASTTKVLSDAGARIGSIYARFTDRELYQLILRREFAPLFRVVDEFVEAIVAENPDGIAGDAIEGFNPAHDACRMIINAGVAIAGRFLGAGIVNQDFLLVGRHIPLESDGATNLRLDDVTFKRKLAAARSFTELAPELDAVLQGDLLALHHYPQIRNDSLAARNTIGAEAYRLECLRPIGEHASPTPFTSTPFYEQYGELRVAEGSYGEVIRYRDHMLPLAEALSEHAATV